MIEITSEQLDRIYKLVSGIEKGPQRVLYNAINRGLSKIRSQGTKEASSVFVLSQANIRANTKTSQRNASPGNNIIGQVKFSGNMIPIFKFKVTGNNQSGLRVQVKRGGGGRLNHAFIANMGNGTNVVERVTSSRTPTETIFGPSAAHMVGHPDVVPNIEDEAQKVVNNRIEHEIERLLNGY